MSRGDGLARQLQLMQILEHRQEIVVPQVADELGYTVRTVYRDLQVLERVGVPIYQDRRGRHARWRVIEGFRRKLSITLSWPEMMALVAARKMIETVGAPPLSEAAASALKKVNDAVPREIAERAAQFDGAISAHVGGVHDYAAKGEALRTLVDAIDRHESIRFRYRKPGERVAAGRVIDPYLLHVQAGALYLIGFCHARNAVRTFLLDRIAEPARTGALFGARAPFAKNAMLQGALGPWEGKPQRIQLRFDAEIAEIVAERRIHPSQSTQWRSDGELDVELRAPVCPPLLSWLMGFGSSVRVLAPAQLADRLRRAHARAAGETAGAARAKAAQVSARRRRG